MADEGKNQVAKNLLDLEPTAVLEFYKLQLDPTETPDGFPQEIPFHPGTIFQGNITWQGVKYIPLALETEGFEVLGDRKLPRPKIRVSNDNQLITLLLQNHKDLVNAKVVRKKAFLKNLDDVNFDGGNPWGMANANAEILDELWLIGRKTHESKLMVEFELNSPLDLESFSVNSRSVISKYCFWQYRGEGCRYHGVPIEREDGTPFLNSTGKVIVPNLTGGGTGFYADPDYQWNAERTYSEGNVVVVANPKIKVPPYAGNVPVETADVGVGLEPIKTCYICVKGNQGQTPELNPTYWQKDGCTKQLGACRKRFNSNNEVSYLKIDTTYSSSFDTIELSGNTNLKNDNAQTAGAFYSLEPTGTQQGLTGILTGTFTLAGWVKEGMASTNLSAIWSTTARGLYQDSGTQWASGDTAKFLNLGSRESYTIVDDEGNAVWTAPPPDMEVDQVLSQYVYVGDDQSPNPIDGSSSVNNVKSNLTTVGAASRQGDQWNFFVITHLGPETPDYVDESTATEMQVWLNPSETTSRNLLQQDDAATPKFASLQARKDPQSDFAGLPEQFMLGSIVSGSVHPTMNGKLGPWALWNRQLTPEERTFLYKPYRSEDTNSSVSYQPRPYSECVDNYSDITGTNLVAWWDMTTGKIPSTNNTGLVDIHSGLYWLTGSGYFTAGTDSVSYTETETANNFSDIYPRYGGFPGTDGYSFGIG